MTKTVSLDTFTMNPNAICAPARSTTATLVTAKTELILPALPVSTISLSYQTWVSAMPLREYRTAQLDARIALITHRLPRWNVLSVKKITPSTPQICFVSSTALHWVSKIVKNV